ncbi:MAG: YetF domain-containing protein [Pseudomonadota bacterium]
MESILRGVLVYAFLLLVFRIAGRRTLADMTAFDFVLTLIISETTQQAMVNSDHSMTNAALLILTLVGTNIGLSMLKLHYPAIEKWLDGRPFIIVENGECLKQRMNKARVDVGDVMEAARKSHGLENMSQIKYAILERGGLITIIPQDTQSR